METEPSILTCLAVHSVLTGNLSPTPSMNFNIIKQHLLSGGLIFTWCSGCSSTVIITRNLPFRGLIPTGCSICAHAWINSVYLGWLTLNVATGVIAGLSSVVKGKGSSKRVTIFCGTFQVSPISDIKLITGFYNIRSSIQKLHNLSFLPRFLVQWKGLRANYIIQVDLLLICDNGTFASIFSAYPSLECPPAS